MEYNLIINHTKIHVKTDSDNDDSMKFVIGEITYDVSYTRIDDNQIHLSVNGMQTNTYVSPNGAGKNIMINGASLYVEDADTQQLCKPGGKKAAGIPDSVTPPMPAVVISVMVEPGDRVTRGQGVVAISAMKMETTLSAPYDGTVTQINTAEGEKVNPGDILVDIEKAEAVEEETQ